MTRSSIGKVYTLDFCQAVAEDMCYDCDVCEGVIDEAEFQTCFADEVQGDSERRQSKFPVCRSGETLEILTNFGKITCKGCIANAKGRDGKHVDNKTRKRYCRRQE